MNPTSTSRMPPRTVSEMRMTLGPFTSHGKDSRCRQDRHSTGIAAPAGGGWGAGPQVPDHKEKGRTR